MNRGNEVNHAIILKQILLRLLMCPVCLKIILEPQKGRCNHSACAKCWGASGKVCKICGKIAGGRLLPDTGLAKAVQDTLAFIECFKSVTGIEVLPRLSNDSPANESDKDSGECFIEKDRKYLNTVTYKKKKSSSPGSKLQSISQFESPIRFTGELIVDNHERSVESQKDNKVKGWLASPENLFDDSLSVPAEKSQNAKKDEVLQTFFVNVLPKKDDARSLIKARPNQKENSENAWKRVKRMKRVLGKGKRKLNVSVKRTPVKKNAIVSSNKSMNIDTMQTPECVLECQSTTSETSIPQIEINTTNTVIDKDFLALQEVPKQSNMRHNSPDILSPDNFTHFSDNTSTGHFEAIKATLQTLDKSKNLKSKVPFIYKGKLYTEMEHKVFCYGKERLNSLPNQNEKNQGLYKWNKTSEGLNLEINISSLFQSEESIDKLNISLKLNNKNNVSSKSVNVVNKRVENEIQTMEDTLCNVPPCNRSNSFIDNAIPSPNIQKRKNDEIENILDDDHCISKRMKMVDNVVFDDNICVQFESQTPTERQPEIPNENDDGVIGSICVIESQIPTVQDKSIKTNIIDFEDDDRYKQLKKSVDLYVGRNSITTLYGKPIVDQTQAEDAQDPVRVADELMGIDFNEVFKSNTPKVTAAGIEDDEMDFTDVVEDTPQKLSNVKVVKRSRISSASLAEEIFIPDTPIQDSLIKSSSKDVDQNTSSENVKVTRSNNKKKALSNLKKNETPKTMDTPSDINKFINNVKRHSTPLQSSAKRSLTYGNSCNKIEEAEISFTDIETGQIVSITNTPVNTKNCLERQFMEQAMEASTEVKGSEKHTKDVSLICSCLSATEKDSINFLIKRKGWKFVDKYNDDVTHLVINVDVANRCQRSLKYVQAVASGCWIVSMDWIKECIKTNSHVKEDAYEALDSSGENGPHLSRVSNLKIFSGMTFFCLPPFLGLTDLELNNILAKAGGKIADNISDVEIKNPKDIMILVGESQETQEQRFYQLSVKFKVIPVNIEWVMESLGKWKADNIHEWLLIERRLLPTIDWPLELLPNDSIDCSIDNNVYKN